MIKVRKSIDIKAPVHDVFEFVNTPENLSACALVCPAIRGGGEAVLQRLSWRAGNARFNDSTMRSMDSLR